MAHRNWQIIQSILFERDIYALLMWRPFKNRATLHMNNIWSITILHDKLTLLQSFKYTFNNICKSLFHYCMQDYHDTNTVSFIQACYSLIFQHRNEDQVQPHSQALTQLPVLMQAMESWARTWKRGQAWQVVGELELAHITNPQDCQATRHQLMCSMYYKIQNSQLHTLGVNAGQKVKDHEQNPNKVQYLYKDEQEKNHNFSSHSSIDH